MSTSSFSCRICNSMRLRSLSRSSICFLMAALWSWLALSLARASDSWSWRLFSAAWTAENVASANAGDLDLAMGDLDLSLSIGERARADGEMDRALDGEIDLRPSSPSNSSASLMTASAMLRRASWRASVSPRICLAVSVSGRS